MAKNININSKEWCDIVFEGKNKSYGAYRIRQTSSKRHILSFIIVSLSIAFLVSIPYLIERIEFYKFQHSDSDSDYVLEDYKYINDNLTELKFKQLSKQYIPNPNSTKKKSTSSKEKRHKAPDLKSRAPVIVAASLIKDYTKNYEEDTVAVKELQKPEEEDETDTDEGLYTVLEIMPSFPGGESGLMDYIYKNLRYPSKAANKKIENCVICTFIIDINGNVTEVEVVQSADPLLDKEAIRIVRSLPKWKPAKKHGRPIRVKYTLPIVFRIK